MGDIVNIENSKYEFDFTLINYREENKEPVSIPITKSSIKYLEIEDSLSNMGYTGKVIFSNFANTLSKLGAFDSSEESPKFLFNIKNKDFEEAKRNIDPLFGLMALDRSTDTSRNVLDRNTAFTFEEYTVAKLKRTNIINAVDPLIQQLGLAQIDLLLFYDNVANLIQCVAVTGAKSYGEDLKTRIKGVAVPAKVTLSQLQAFTENSDIYSVLEQLESYLCFEQTGTQSALNFKQPGTVRLETSPDFKTRELVISPLSQDINAFFQEIGSSSPSSNTSNYLLEKFSVDFANEAAAYKDNFITRYDIMRANYNEVFRNKWCNVAINLGSGDDRSCDNTPIIKYQHFRTGFERLFTSPFGSNLPSREDDIKKNNIKKLEVNKSTSALDDNFRDLKIASVSNTVFKSFVFDNVALVFRVKGQTYRKPGKFIQVIGDNTSIENSRGRSSGDEISGYWYVISVSHIFENDIYFNEFICVKIHNIKKAASQWDTADILSYQTPAGILGPSTSLNRSPAIRTPSFSSAGLNPEGEALLAEVERITRAEERRSAAVALGAFPLTPEPEGVLPPLEPE